MKPWHHGLPEATSYMLFPPAGQAEAFLRAGDRVKAYLAERLPGLSFEIERASLGERAMVIPILGEAGEGGSGIHCAPPSQHRLCEIEAELRGFDLARTGLS